jgi:hypothetical protein
MTIKLPPYNTQTVREWVSFQQRYDLLTQTILNGAAEFGRRCAVASEVSTVGYFYGLQVPPGRRLYVWSRDIEVTQGAYEIDLLQAPDGFTGGNPAFKHNLFQDGASTIQSEVFCGATPVNALALTTLFQFPFVDTGTAVGNARVGGSPSADAVLRSFTGANNMLRVRRTAAAAFTSSISLIAWEEDDV